MSWKHLKEEEGRGRGLRQGGDKVDPREVGSGKETLPIAGFQSIVVFYIHTQILETVQKQEKGGGK